MTNLTQTANTLQCRSVGGQDHWQFWLDDGQHAVAQQGIVYHLDIPRLKYVERHYPMGKQHYTPKWEQSRDPSKFVQIVVPHEISGEFA
ncbi:MAG: hypothetical protein NT172_11360 [Planctomycetota bacterium]|nr:hypothetical protein [Planctomycetota bacterium]